MAHGIAPFRAGYNDGDGEAVIRGLGSQAGVLGGGLEACNGVVFVVDRVLLPVDLDGELNRRRGGRELPSTTRIACFDMHTIALKVVKPLRHVVVVRFHRMGRISFFLSVASTG